MLIDVQAGKRTDINLIFALCRQRIGHLLVQTMDTFYYQYIVRSQSCDLAAVLPFSGLKVKSRQLHALPLKQIAHVLVKLLHIQSLEAFIIRLPLIVKRRLVMVQVIIIQPDRMGLQTVGAKLDRQSVGERRLTGR